MDVYRGIRVIFGDGIFYMVLTIFCQHYNLHAKDAGRMVKLVFLLLPDGLSSSSSGNRLPGSGMESMIFPFHPVHLEKDTTRWTTATTKTSTTSSGSVLYCLFYGRLILKTCGYMPLIIYVRTADVIDWLIMPPPIGSTAVLVDPLPHDGSQDQQQPGDRQAVHDSDDIARHLPLPYSPGAEHPSINTTAVVSVVCRRPTIANMETEGRHPYKRFENEDCDGVPRQPTPPYSPGTAKVVVTQPQTVVHRVQSPPSSFMWLSIISCCFCWPMAICAIMASNESTSAAAAGDYDTARSKGRTAMGIALAAIVIGIVITAVIVVVKIQLYQEAEKELNNSGY